MEGLSQNSSELLVEARRSILFTANRPEIVMERGDGMFLWDTNGRRYLDFIGGWAVTSLGHCPPAITDALIQQSRQLVNASPSFYNKPMIEFAKLLTENSCFDRVFFASSGAEANESAIKLARKYGTKYKNGAFEIITMINSFHGRTLATMSASGKKHWEGLFDPKVSGFKHVPMNDIGALQAAMGPMTCAIMLEPIQGEGGVFAAGKEYIRQVRRLCDEIGALLVFDEIQTGVGRTGTLFAYEQYEVEPDIMTLAKGIGGGFPLAAMLTKEKFNIFDPGDQGGTYSGQPLAMAVGIAVLSEVLSKNLPQNVENQGAYLVQRLEKLAAKYKLVNIRGKGLLVAFNLPLEMGSVVVSECLASGLLINSPQPATIRLMPPLIVNEQDIDEMINILDGVLAKVLGSDML